MDEDARLLTVTEAAERLRKSKRFVLDELRRENLRGSYFGGQWHIKPDDLDEYVESQMNIRPVYAPRKRK